MILVNNLNGLQVKPHIERQGIVNLQQRQFIVKRATTVLCNFENCIEIQDWSRKNDCDQINIAEHVMEWNLPASVIAARMGERVRIRRMEAELSVEELASVIGRSQAEMEAIEAGQDTLKAQEIVALCRLLEVPPSWFFEELL